MYVKRHEQFGIGSGAILNKPKNIYYNIIIFYLYSATSIIVCGASQHNAIKNTIKRKLPTDNIYKKIMKLHVSI